MTCAMCNIELRRKRRETLTDYVRGCLCFFPYFCPGCQKTQLVIHWEQAAMFYGTLCIAFFTMLTGALVYRSTHRRIPQASALSISIAQAMAANSDIAPRGEAGQIVIPAKPALTNKDIAALAEAKLAPDVMTRLIRSTPHNFQIDPASLIALKKAGTPDIVISAMIDSTTTQQPGQQLVTASFHSVPF